MEAYHARPKSSLKMRWVVLLLVCIVMVGTYYSLDVPAAIHHQLQDTLESDASATTTRNFEFYFNMLFSVYSMPNMLLPFFGGSCVDRIGSSRSAARVRRRIFTIMADHVGWPVRLRSRG
jgi:MFS family permease